VSLTQNIPSTLREKYLFEERGHASAILRTDFPQEFADIIDALDQFRLCRSYVVERGGGRSSISQTLDGLFHNKGWIPRTFNVSVTVDQTTTPFGTHEIDEFKNGVGVEIEWNNKTEFYDRDLTHFRLMHDLRIISVGVIITRTHQLQPLFDSLGIGEKYGRSTTIWEHLIEKVNMGSAGGCPLLLVAIARGCYDPQC